MHTPACLALAFLLASGTPLFAAPLVYSGELRDGGAAANGLYDFEISLHAHREGGAALLPPQQVRGVPVERGQFRFSVDLPEPGTADAWVQIGVRGAGEAGFEALGRRGKLTELQGAASCWSLAGNAGTNPGVDVLGTTDGTPLQLHGPLRIGATGNNASSFDLVLGKNNIDNDIEFDMRSPSGHSAQFRLFDNDGGLQLLGDFGARFAIGYTTSVGGGGLLPAGVEFAVQPRGVGNADFYMSAHFANPPEGINLATSPPSGAGLFAPFSITQTNGAEFRPRFAINTFGDIEMATRLFVFGDAFKPGGGSWGNSSDARVKREIAPLRDAVQTLLRVEPVRYRYDAEFLAAHPGVVDRRYHGFIAQDFRKVFPESVVEMREKVAGGGENLLSVDPQAAFVTAVAAIQELAARQELLEAEVARLRAELEKRN